MGIVEQLQERKKFKNSSQNNEISYIGIPLVDLRQWAKIQGRELKDIQNECDKGYWPTVQLVKGGLRFINLDAVRAKLEQGTFYRVDKH